MEYEINSCNYDVVFDNATIDIEQAVVYIKSGEQEIKSYVDNVSKPEIDNHVETVNKKEISRYVIEEKQPEIDEYIDNYINNESKPELNNYLQNDIKPALQAFAHEKTLQFDNNAQAKQAQVDASAQAAANSETMSIEKANLAAQSASEAKTSETNARVSETNAKDSEKSCKDILERLGTVIKIKGRVDSIDDLPSTGNLNGDVYLVGVEGLESYPEYYWFDDHWEFIGISSDKLEWGTLQGDISAQTDLQQALNSKVNLTDNQTISGAKAFANNIYRRMTDLDVTTTPTTTQYLDWLSPQDKNGVSVGYFGTVHRNSGELGSRLGVTRFIDGVGKYQDISINIAKDGTVISYAPTPPTTDNSTQIATTANVDAKITAQAVKLTGNQTIAGAKTFTSSLTTKTGGSAMLKGVLPNNTVGTNPSSSVNVYVAGADSGNKDQSYISFGVGASGNGFVNVMARSNSATDRGSTGLQINRNLDGTSWASFGTTTVSAPTPATSDNSTKVATTANVDAKITAQAVKLTGDQTINGVKTFSSSPKVPTVAASTNDTTAASCQWVNSRVNNIVNGKLVYDSGDLTLSSNTNSVITLSNALSSSELHKYQVIVLIKPNSTIQNFTTDMYLNAQSGYFFEKNNSIVSTTGILTGLSTTQIRYKTGNYAVYYAEGVTYDWSNFKARFLIYKM